MLLKKNFIIKLSRNTTAALAIAFAAAGAARAADGDVGTSSQFSTQATITAQALFRISNVVDFAIDDQVGVEVALRNDTLFRSDEFGICVWTNDANELNAKVEFESAGGVAKSALANEFMMLATSHPDVDKPFIKYGIEFNAVPAVWAATVGAGESGKGRSASFPAGSITNQSSTNCGGPDEHNRSVKITIAASELHNLLPNYEYSDTITMTLRAF